jgi:hypothetical protein
MLTDLAALTPPLLVAVAVLIAAGAFVRHEMRRGKNATEDEQDEQAEESAIDSSQSPDANESDGSSAQRSSRENIAEDGPDGGH